MAPAAATSSRSTAPGRHRPRPDVRGSGTQTSRRWIPACSSRRRRRRRRRGQPHRRQSVRDLCARRRERGRARNTIVGIAGGPLERDRQRRIGLECAWRQGARQRHPLRPRRHLHDSASKESVHRQPLPRSALRGPLHVHQRQRGQRQRLGRQCRRLRHHVLEPPGDPRQRLRPRPRPRASVQLRQRLRRSWQHACSAARSRRNAGRAAAARRRARARHARDRRPAAAAPDAASDRKNACSSTTPTRTGSATTGSKDARSASTSPPDPRATRSSATPSSAIATR